MRLLLTYSYLSNAYTVNDVMCGWNGFVTNHNARDCCSILVPYVREAAAGAIGCAATLTPPRSELFVNSYLKYEHSLSQHKFYK